MNNDESPENQPKRYYIGKEPAKVEWSYGVPKHWDGKRYYWWELKDQGDNWPDEPEDWFDSKE